LPIPNRSITQKGSRRIADLLETGSSHIDDKSFTAISVARRRMLRPTLRSSLSK